MRFSFGDVVVDVGSRLVLRGGTAVHVSPKAFDLLVTLIRERPRVLSKEDLHARLWPDTFVSDTSLAMLVAEMRAALGESAREPRTIRTVHRRGYAFQAQARVIPPAAPLPAAAQATTGAATACSLVASSRRYPLLRGDNIVGRDPAAHVWLDSASVSRRHACIRVEGDRVTIEDLESKNGTRVSGVPVMAPTTLADGDQLQFGSIAAVFSAWAADATITEGGS